MNTSEILAMRVADVGLTRVMLKRLCNEWVTYHSYPRLQPMYGDAWQEKAVEMWPTLTVGEIIADCGDIPVKEYSNTRVGLVIVPFEHFSFLRLSSPLEAFVEKLREMGLTSREWPFLAPGIYAILNANIERAGEEKEKLKQLPAIVLNMSRKMATGIRYACLNKRETVVCPKWSELTIGMLLTFSPFLIRKMADANDVTQSIRATREKLRLLGFTNDDGPFLAEGTREAAIKTVAKDLQVSKDKASEILDYFRWVGFEILD